MKKTEEIAQLLRGNSFPTILERIPVRHLTFSKSPLPYYVPNNESISAKIPNCEIPVNKDLKEKLMHDKHAKSTSENVKSESPKGRLAEDF